MRPRAGEPIDPVAFGERLGIARRRRGLKQADLVATGVGATYISRLEAGQRHPSGNAVDHLAARLGVNREWLAYGRGPRDAGAVVPRVVIEFPAADGNPLAPSIVAEYVECYALLYDGTVRVEGVSS